MCIYNLLGFAVSFEIIWSECAKNLYWFQTSISSDSCLFLLCMTKNDPNVEFPRRWYFAINLSQPKAPRNRTYARCSQFELLHHHSKIVYLKKIEIHIYMEIMKSNGVIKRKIHLANWPIYTCFSVNWGNSMGREKSMKIKRISHWICTDSPPTESNINDTTTIITKKNRRNEDEGSGGNEQKRLAWMRERERERDK